MVSSAFPRVELVGGQETIGFLKASALVFVNRAAMTASEVAGFEAVDAKSVQQLFGWLAA